MFIFSKQLEFYNFFLIFVQFLYKKFYIYIDISIIFFGNTSYLTSDYTIWSNIFHNFPILVNLADSYQDLQQTCHHIFAHHEQYLNLWSWNPLIDPSCQRKQSGFWPNFSVNLWLIKWRSSSPCAKQAKSQLYKA